MVGVLRMKMRGQTAQCFASILATTDPTLLREAGADQVGKILRALVAVRSYAAMDGGVSKHFYTVRAKGSPPGLCE